MTFTALFLVWLSGFMTMSSVMCFSGRDQDRWTGTVYAVLAFAFVIPAVVEMLP